MKRVTVDPGHSGPSEPGAVGRVTGLHEADVNLRAAFILEQKLQARGWSVLLTRRDNIQSDGLTFRANMSNDFNSDIFISLHCNAADNPAAEGFECFTSPGWTQADIYCDRVIEAIGAAFPGRASRGSKEANFTVLTATDAPALLLEMAFISNSEEEGLLNSTAFLDTMMEAVAGALDEG